MTLKGCFIDDWNGEPTAIIYKEAGEIVFSAPAKDEREAQVRCMDNAETRKTLFEKLNVHKLPKIEWMGDEPDEVLFDPEQDKEKDPAAKEPAETPEEAAPCKAEPETIFRDVPVKMSADAFEEKVKRLILDLEDVNMAIVAENEKHKNTKKELEGREEAIKDKLYDARRGNLKTTVECNVVMDYASGLKRIIRIDTGEILEEIEMTSAEKQIDALPETKEPAGEIIPLEIGPKSPNRFDVWDGQEWVESLVGKIKKGQKFRIFNKKERIKVAEKEEFVAVKNAKKARDTGIVKLECRAV